MTAAVIDPRGLDAVEWMDYTADEFSALIPPFRVTGEGQWREWGANARRAQSRVPDPYQFADWRTWAERFNQVMYLN